MAKKQIRISVDAELLKEARDLGLDLGRILELAIKSRAATLRDLNKTENTEAS